MSLLPRAPTAESQSLCDSHNDDCPPLLSVSLFLLLVILLLLLLTFQNHFLLHSTAHNNFHSTAPHQSPTPLSLSSPPPIPCPMSLASVFAHGQPTVSIPAPSFRVPRKAEEIAMTLRSPSSYVDLVPSSLNLLTYSTYIGCRLGHLLFVRLSMYPWAHRRLARADNLFRRRDHWQPIWLSNPKLGC